MIINMGSGHSVTATHVGNTSITLMSEHSITLDNCLILPNGLKNIVSIPVLVRKRYLFTFNDNGCDIYFRNKNVGSASLANGLYYINVQTIAWLTL